MSPYAESGAIGWGLAVLGLLAVLVLLARLVRPRRGGDVSTISIGELVRRQGAGSPVTLLDVRSVSEFEGELGHISGSVCIPVDELAGRLDELAAARSGGLVVVCRTDRRSTRAAELLTDAGFVDVTVLAGGMEAWNRAGGPNEHGKESAP